MLTHMRTPLDTAIEKLGGPAVLAEILNITPQAVGQWKGKPPAKRVLKIEEASGVSRHLLRPDIFGPA
jgi:DNA-binding transcriptional regulator YdaS (Cro superfamily)